MVDVFPDSEMRLPMLICLGNKYCRFCRKLIPKKEIQFNFAPSDQIYPYEIKFQIIFYEN